MDHSEPITIAPAPPRTEAERDGLTPAAWHAHVREELAALHQALDALGQGVVEMTPQGHIRWATTRAWQWLARYWGRDARLTRRAPASLVRWADRTAAVQSDEGRRLPFLVAGYGRQLSVRLAVRASRRWLFLEEQAVGQAASLEPAGLTPREADVLAWLAQGKSNVDIAAILAISPRTVQKHLERIFVKLGVESRTAAAAYVIEHWRDHPLQPGPDVD